MNYLIDEFQDPFFRYIGFGFDFDFDLAVFKFKGVVFFLSYPSMSQPHGCGSRVSFTYIRFLMFSVGKRRQGFSHRSIFAAVERVKSKIAKNPNIITDRK